MALGVGLLSAVLALLAGALLLAPRRKQGELWPVACVVGTLLVSPARPCVLQARAP